MQLTAALDNDSKGSPAPAVEAVAPPLRSDDGFEDAKKVAAVEFTGNPGQVARIAPANRWTIGFALSIIAHGSVLAAALAYFSQVQPYANTGGQSVDLVMITASPPPSFSMPPPAAPPPLSADVLPAPRLPAPEPPPLLSASLLAAPELPPPFRPAQLSVELLAGPELKAPAPPPALPPALLPPPKVTLPPETPDPAGVLVAALPKSAPIRKVSARTERRKSVQKPRQKNIRATPRKTKETARKRVRAKARKQTKARELARERLRKKQNARKRIRARKAQERLRKKNARLKQTNARRTRLASRTSNVSSRTSRKAQKASRRGASAAAYSGLVAARLRRNMPDGNIALLGQGTATVAFRIAASGRATGVRVIRSAGHRALDRAAMATVRRASPFPPPPAGARRSFRVPVRFRR